MKITKEEAELWEEIFKGFVKGKNYQMVSKVDAGGNVLEYKKLTGMTEGIRTLEITNGMFLIDPNVIEEEGKPKKDKSKNKEKKHIFKKILKGLLNG